MSEQPTQTQSTTESTFRGDPDRTRLLLRIVYGLVPIIAGIDKFTNLLTTWTDYLPSAIVAVLPVEAQVFMYVVGMIEIIAGVVVLSRYTEYGAYLVAIWLTVIAITQLIGGNYDIAVRDLVMAVGAIALAQLDAATNYGVE